MGRVGKRHRVATQRDYELFSVPMGRLRIVWFALQPEGTIVKLPGKPSHAPNGKRWHWEGE